MDINSSTMESSSKKRSLEELTKDELVKKCRSLLEIAQRAKQTKDTLTEENHSLRDKLKCTAASDELIENLTQQKLAMVTSLEELKNQRRILGEKLSVCEDQLYTSESKIADLDTENVSCKRQIARLTDENEQLITHLDTLEKQIEELKSIGLTQQQQLLQLEENNALLAENNVSKVDNYEALAELQNMLSVSLEEVKKLKLEKEDFKEKMENALLLIQERDKNLISMEEELLQKTNQIENLQIEINNLQNKPLEVANTDLEDEITILKTAMNESAESIQVYQQEIELKNKEIEKHTNIADDLNTEIHKNRALIQKLKQDIANMSNKLNENQIVSSGLTTDLQNVNEKLREKVKLYHSKLVKFAGDIKKLKESRNYLLISFKTYNEQVKSWQEQLTVATQRLSKEISNDEMEKSKLREEIGLLNGKIVNMSEQKGEMINQSIALNAQSEQNVILLAENKELNNKVNILNKEIQLFQNNLQELNEKHVEELMEKSKKYDDQVNILTKETQSLQSSLQELNWKYENELSERSKTCGDEIRSKLNECENELKILKEKPNTDLRINDELIKQNEQLQQKIDALTFELSNTQSENDNLNAALQKNELIIDENNRLICELKNAIERLEAEVERSKSTETKLAEQSGQEIIKLANENKDLRDKNSSFEVKIEQLENKLGNVSNDLPSVNELEEKVNSLKRENTELLTEMNEMNQALKERGETISKQQAYCDEVLKKIGVYESQANKNVDTISQNNETIKTLENEIVQLKSRDSENAEVLELRKEISVLKDRLTCLDTSQDCNYAESETLSTSTISRSEESSRLKDLEGSWEERYGKLRTLAIKLKVKIRELSNELTREQAEKSDLQTKLANSLKTVQTTQLQCDNLQDELEVLRKDNKNYNKKLDSLVVNINKDKNQLASNDETISKLKNEIENLTKEKSNVESWKKQVSSKVQTLKKELEANTVLKKDFESRIQKLTNDLEAKEKELKEEKDKHNQTRSSLQESNNECKKQSVLNLEMQDYERSIKDMSQKLEKKNELVNKLKNQIDSQKSTVNTVKEENRLLEERTSAFETEINAYRIEVNTFKKNITELEMSLLEKESKIHEVLKSLEDSRSENEDLNTQLSNVIAEHQKINNILKSEKDHFRSENLGLEQRLREVEDKLKLKDDELETMKNEYQGYKVRAQSVLRQNQSRDVGLEEKLTEEAATLRAQVAILKTEIAELKIQVDKFSIENEKLVMEKIQIESSRSQFSNEAEECRREYEKINFKYQQAVMDHAETVRGLKVHADTLSQCYRQQISEQEARHNREIIELQSKIEKGGSPPDIPSLILPTTPREEGEGSESVDSANGNIHPLEKLLGADQDQEINLIKKQLTDNELKVVHLTALLADTEQDLAKHVQMNKVLKEEIRRQQRSVEREKHAENLEYMKNVVFKFITLSSGDERQRLVPVLNTILKLSPEETHKLNLVAKGDKSWSNYLPLWSSGKQQ